MGGVSWSHSAAAAAGDPHSRSLRRPKPVYSGLILERCWATAQHGIAQSQPIGLGWLLSSYSRNSSAQRTRPKGSIFLQEHYEDLVFDHLGQRHPAENLSGHHAWQRNHSGDGDRSNDRHQRDEAPRALLQPQRLRISVGRGRDRDPLRRQWHLDAPLGGGPLGQKPLKPPAVGSGPHRGTRRSQPRTHRLLLGIPPGVLRKVKNMGSSASPWLFQCVQWTFAV